MRAAIVQALLADPGVAALVGARVYPRVAVWGGLPTPEVEAAGGPPSAFTPEGDLVGAAVVVIMSARARHPDDRGEGTRIRAVQTFSLFVYAPEGLGGDAYAVIREVHRAARRVLHRQALTPLEEDVAWLDTRWGMTGAELVEAPRNIPVIEARYDAIVTDPL